jgi:hypothetical protein
MGVDIGGAFTVAGVSGTQALKIAGAFDAFTIDTTGRTFYPNQIGFSAGLNSDPSWVAMTSAVWNIQNYLNTTTFNRGGCFNTSNSRFTAPVTGAYLLYWSAYQYKPSAVPGHYVHPMFWVNGAIRPDSYRLKAYHTPTGYSFDSEIVDIFYLNAGDYVEVQIYAAAAGISLYRAHAVFSGYLVG